MCQKYKSIFDLSPFISNYFQHSCRAVENWLFCKTWVVCRLVRFCKCANVRLAKIIFLNVRWEKFLKHSGRIVCRQSQLVSSSQDVKVRFSDVYFFGVLSFSRLAYNGLGLGEVADF
jgi:hypothetical protein